MKISLWTRYRWRGQHRRDRNRAHGCTWCDSVTGASPCTCRVRCVSGSCAAPEPPASPMRRTIAAMMTNESKEYPA